MDWSQSRRRFLTALGITSTAPALTAISGGLTLQGAASQVVPAGDSYVHMNRVLLAERTRKEVREWLDSGLLKAAIVPTGSTEQHNEHLAMIQDTASAMLVAQLAALRIYPQAVVTPAVPIGISPYWMERRGTLTFRPETFLACVFDICDSLKTHGFSNVLVLNGHGGNDLPLKSHLKEWKEKLGIRIEACSYWEACSRENSSSLMQSGFERIPGHSAEFETSIALAAFPERVRHEGIDYSKVRLNLKNPEDAAEDRKYFEESRFATAGKGEAFIRIAVEWVAGKLINMLAEP